jgi:hypothetical protein
MLAQSLAVSSMEFMNKTPRINTKILRSTCPHSNVIELDDRTKVCIRCEAVIPAAK